MNTERWLLLGMLSFAATVHAAPDKLPGEQIYARCAACHALAYDRVGPHHCGLLGRRAGTVPGFAYSDAMKNSGVVWTRDKLAAYIEAPKKVVSGTRMIFWGISDPQKIDNLLAYLETFQGQ